MPAGYPGGRDDSPLAGAFGSEISEPWARVLRAMASRKEEKEARRAERIAAERAEQAGAQRTQRLIIGGAVLLALVVVGLGIALLAGSGGDDENTTKPNTSVPIPARKISDLNAAAKKAGCVVKSFPNEGQLHFDDNKGVNNNYKTNPPTSGEHRPTPAPDGIYAPGNEPDKENWVHTLEHGRIEYQYAPGTPQQRIDQLQTLYAESFRGLEGYHQMVLQNNTKMPFAVAAVAWRNYAACKTFTDDTFDVFRAFREQFVDKAPEQIP
jgi:hypothetical protein